MSISQLSFINKTQQPWGCPERLSTDYVIMAGFLTICFVVGVVQACIGGKQRTQREYLIANRKLQVLPVTMSILVSYMSAILILGTPAEVYISGTKFWWYPVGGGVSGVIVVWLFVPLLYPLKLTSCYEVREISPTEKEFCYTGP